MEESIRGPLRERDRALGLGPEGPVLRAIEETASRGAADVNGKATFEAVLDPIPKLHCSPVVTGSKDTICLPMVQVTIIGTNVDPSNLGATPRRVVHAHVVSERPL